MRTILITGANGFIGRNLAEALGRLPGLTLLKVDITDKPKLLEEGLASADVVFHLAGVNRPEKEEDYIIGNADLTSSIVSSLLRRASRPLLVLSSSIQAQLDNPYGRSKRKAEEALEEYAKEGGSCAIFRLPNVFGKWSRPNYNSAVATFCYNIARDLDIAVSEQKRIVELVYIDDVIRALVGLLSNDVREGVRRPSVGPVTRISLAALVSELLVMRDIRSTLEVPDFADYFRRSLYATYLSFLPTDGFDYALTRRNDDRGTLAELFKSAHFGQIFVSRTKAGITRGNHFHDTKVEKFCVVEGKGIIRFRHIQESEILEYSATGEELRVLDIPPGYTHSIENVGTTDMVVLFWSIEPFNPECPDTYPLTV